MILTVLNGGDLVIDGGILANASIQLTSSSNITIKNGGKIFMRKNHDLYAPVGCVVNVIDGEICGPYVKKSEIWE